MPITHVLSIVSRDRWSQVRPTPYFQRFLILHLKLTQCFSRWDHSFHWCIAKAHCLKRLPVFFRLPFTSIPNSIKDHACCNFCVSKNQSPTIQKTALNQCKPLLRLLWKWQRRTVHRKYFSHPLSSFLSQFLSSNSLSPSLCSRLQKNSPSDSYS